MHTIKIVLVLAVLLIVVLAFRNRRSVGIRAGARVLVIALAALAIASIVNTDIPQAVANHLGVARGTDLILYLLVLAFALTSTGLYFRCRELDQRLTTIVRVNAIRDAILSDGMPGANSTAARGSDQAEGTQFNDR